MRQNAINLKLKAHDLYSRTYKKFGKENDKLRSARKKDDKAVLKSRDVQRKYQKTLKDLSSYSKLTQTLKQNSFAFKAAQEKVTGLSNAFKAAERPTQRMASQLENAKIKANNLKRKFEQNSYAAGQLKNSLRNAGIQTQKLGTAKDKLKSKISALTPKINAETAAHNRQMGVLRKLRELRERKDRRLQRGANMAITGYGMLGAGRALGRGLLAPILKGARFEKSMSKVAALTGAKRGSNDFNMLQGNAEGLGATTAFSASQVAEGQGFLAMAGFKPQQIVKSMSGVVNMALASGLDMGQTADIGSDIMTAFGLKAENMGHIGDVLTKTFTSSNTSLSMVGDTMKYIAPVAKNLGIDMETAAAMTGLLGNAGIKGTQAGTGLRAMMLKLAAPVKKGRKALKLLGMTTLDAQGNMKPFTEILAEIAEKTKKMGSGVKAGIIKDLVGTEASTALTVLLEQSTAEQIRSYAKQVRDSQGIAKEVADEMADNLSGDWTKFNSVVEAISNTFTKSLNPSLRGGVQWITEMGSGLNNLMKEYPKVTKVAGIFVGALSGIMIVGGGAMIAMGGIAGAMALTSWSAGVIGASRFGTALKFVGRAALWMGRAMLMNPIGLAITAIVGAGYIIYKYWKPIKKFFSNLWEGTKQKWASFTNWVGNMWNKIGKLWETAKQKLSSFTLADIGKGIIKGLIIAFTWSPLGLLIKGFTKAKEWLSTFDMSSIAAGIANGLKAPFVAIFDWFDLKFSNFFKNLSSGSFESGKVLQSQQTQDGKYVGPGGAMLGDKLNAFGQPIKRAFGGWAFGAGTSRSDSIPAMLSNGEHVTQAPMARQNVGLLNGINAGKITEIGIKQKIAAAAIAASMMAAPVAVAANTATHGGQTITIAPQINIYAAPGMDAQEIADLVADKMHEVLAINGSNLFD